jgi:hypothetical protein
MLLEAQCGRLDVPCVTIRADTPREERVRLADFFIGQVNAWVKDPPYDSASASFGGHGANVGAQVC